MSTVRPEIAAVAAVRRPLPFPRWTGSTAAALLDGLGALALGAILLLEPPGGYDYPTFHGVERVLAWAPGPPLAVWGGIYAAVGVAILAGRGRPWTRYVLLLLTASLAAYGMGSLAVGITSADAASTGGTVFLWLALTVWRDALALGRRR